MKKIFLLATAAVLITGASFADNGKKKNKAKGKTCCSKSSKSCTKDKDTDKTAKL